MIWDVGGLTPVPGAKLIEQMVQQGLTFNPEVLLNEKVESIARNEEGLFELHTANSGVHLSKTVIVAVGGGILNPQKLDIEGAERFEVSNLNYTVKSPAAFQGQNGDCVRRRKLGRGLGERAGACGEECTWPIAKANCQAMKPKSIS